MQQPPITTAEELCSAIGPNAQSISRWDSTEQMYKPHACGTLFGNFALSSLEGYEISVGANTTWIPEGCPVSPEPIDLIKKPGSTGLNYIGFPYNSAISPFTAEGLCQNISDAQSISLWDPIEQEYEPHACGTVFGNFTLSIGTAYEISVSANTTWTPG